MPNKVRTVALVVMLGNTQTKEQKHALSANLEPSPAGMLRHALPVLKARFPFLEVLNVWDAREETMDCEVPC